MPLFGTLRRIDSNPYTATQTVNTKLPIIKYGRDLLLRLSGTLTTGTTPTTAIDAPFSLIKALEIVGASGDSTKSGSLHRLSAFDLYVLNAFETGSYGYIKRHGSANATPYAFEGFLVIPWSTLPLDSLNLLPHPAFNDLQLQVTWGQLSDLGTNIGASFTVAPALDIYELTREVAPTQTPIIMKTVVKTLNLNPSIDNDIDITTGLPIQSALVRVNDNSVRSDSFCTQVNLIENDTIRHIDSMPWTVLQMYNRYRGNASGGAMGYPFVEAADVNTSTRVGLGTSNRSTITGFNYLNFPDILGQLLQTGPATVINSVKLRLTTTTSAGGTPNALVILRERAS